MINYRDHLRINKRRKANTAATKLAIVRSFFEYLKAGVAYLLDAHLSWVPLVVVKDELPDDPDVSLLRANAIMLKPEAVLYLFE